MTVYHEHKKGLPMPEHLKKEVEEAMKMPIVFDEDCPEMTKEMKQAFIRERKNKPCNAKKIVLYLSGETVAKAEEIFGENYTAALGKLLDWAVQEYAVG